MLLIAICDDEASAREQVRDAVTTCLQERCIEAKVLVYDCAENLIAATEGNRVRFDIIFLDIIMGGLDGMACARLIRRQDTQVNIFFLTHSADFVYDGYEVNAAAYLMKPIHTEKLAVALDKTIARLEEAAKESITVTCGGVTWRLLIKDILYAESKKNRVEIVTSRTAERLAIYTTLDRFGQLHPSAMWIRSHKSFTVNFLYVEQYSTDKFVLRDGTVIPISRIYKEIARERFFTLLHNL